MAISKTAIMAELKSLLAAMIYFSLWLGIFILLKKLILAEYEIEYRGLSMMLVGALVLAKVVLILEHVSLGSWVRRQPAWVDVVLRTALYALGALVIMALERAFESRHEHGGFGNALGSVTRGVDLHHLLASLLCVTGALLVYNISSVLRDAFGPGVVLKKLREPRESESIKHQEWK